MSKPNHGSIMIVTLWILSILSVMAAGMAFRLSLELCLNRNFLDQLSADSIAWAGLVRAEEAISKNQNDFDSILECGFRLESGQKPEDIFKGVSLGGGSFSVQYDGPDGPISGMSDEDRKINLNIADEATLIAILTVAGNVKDPFLARQIANAIIDWRDEDHESSMQEGAEDYYYRGLPNAYECADRPFRTMEELMLVKGMTPEIFQKIEKAATVYGADGQMKVNLNTASSTVIEVIGVAIGMGDVDAHRVAEHVVELRRGADKKEGTLDDFVFGAADIAALETRAAEVTRAIPPTLMPAFKNSFKSASSYYRIRSSAKMDNSPVVAVLEAVAKVEANKGRPSLVYFHRH